MYVRRYGLLNKDVYPYWHVAALATANPAFKTATQGCGCEMDSCMGEVAVCGVASALRFAPPQVAEQLHPPNHHFPRRMHLLGPQTRHATAGWCSKHAGPVLRSAAEMSQCNDSAHAACIDTLYQLPDRSQSSRPGP
jgi:hypothetical protein